MSKDPPKPRTAVALRYDGQYAPRIVAKGHGETAQRIQETAAAHGIPLHEDAQLATVLAQLELDTRIPPALYLAVAEVLALAYRLSGKLPPPPPPGSHRGTRPDPPADDPDGANGWSE